MYIDKQFHLSLNGDDLGVSNYKEVKRIIVNYIAHDGTCNDIAYLEDEDADFSILQSCSYGKNVNVNKEFVFVDGILYSIKSEFISDAKDSAEVNSLVNNVYRISHTAVCTNKMVCGKYSSMNDGKFELRFYKECSNEKNLKSLYRLHTSLKKL